MYYWLALHDRGALPSRCFWLTFCEIISEWRFNTCLSGTLRRLGKMRENIVLPLNVEPPCSLDPNSLSLFDEQHSDDEERWTTLGLDHTGTLMVICHTYREETGISARVRLISARKATKNATEQYQRK